MSAVKPKVLIVDDEPQIRRFLRAALASHGYDWLEAERGEDCLARAVDHRPDLIILDLGLPDLDGLDVIQRLREWSRVPVIVLSARGQERDKITALDAGADDYLTKPFGVGELLARARVALRNAARTETSAGPAVFEAGDLKIDLARRLVFVKGGQVHLTPLEYRLLTALARLAGRVFTHRQLLSEVWGPSSVEETHYLRVYMAQLRSKLEEDPAQPRYLITEPGVGYRLVDE